MAVKAVPVVAVRIPPKTDNTAKQEEQKAKTRANALIANIKAFYEEQKSK